MLTDALGDSDAILLDLRKATGNENAEFLGCESISPDGRFILAAYYHTRTPEENAPDAHLLLLDITDLSLREVPVSHEDFELAWFRDTHWLDEHTFLVPLNRFTKREHGYSRETVCYLRKQIDDLSATRTIAFPSDDPVCVWHPKSSALLFASEHEVTMSWTVWALDIDGKRKAAPSETNYFNHKYLDRAYDPESTATVEIDKVIDAVEGWGRYWEENWMRYWILLDGKRVRCSDGEIERDPVWDSDLRLFIWYEIGTPYQVFRMDAEGHYRKWHTGHYWGKIPKREAASNKTDAGDA